MRYVPPPDGGPDGPYVDARPEAGLDGSIVPAAAIEHVQREIVNAITAAGLTPSAETLDQLAQAIVALADHSIPNATTTVAGRVELATEAEVGAGTDAVRAVTPAALAATLPSYGFAAPTAQTAAIETNTTQIATTAFVTSMLRRFGLGGGQGTGGKFADIWAVNNADAANRTGIYTTSGTTNVPYGAAILFHLERSLAAGVSALQIAPDNVDGLHYRTAKGTGASRIWSAWKALATTAPASETALGMVELATVAEAQAGTDTARAVTPKGVHEAFGQFGLGGAPSILIDVNTLTKSGFYYAVVGSSGLPAGFTSGYVIPWGLVGAGLTQLFVPVTSDRFFLRRRDPAGNWQPWRETWLGEQASQSLAVSGYQRLPSGLILQWGKTAATTAGNATVSVTFPITFPSSVYSVLTTKDVATAAGTGTQTPTAAGNLSRSGFTAVYDPASSAISSGIMWAAFGR